MVPEILQQTYAHTYAVFSLVSPPFSRATDTSVLEDILRGVSPCISKTFTWHWFMTAELSKGAGSQESPSARVPPRPTKVQPSCLIPVYGNPDIPCQNAGYSYHKDHLLFEWNVSGSQYHSARRPHHLIVSWDTLHNNNYNNVINVTDKNNKMHNFFHVPFYSFLAKRKYLLLSMHDLSFFAQVQSSLLPFPILPFILSLFRPGLNTFWMQLPLRWGNLLVEIKKV